MTDKPPLSTSELGPLPPSKKVIDLNEETLNQLLETGSENRRTGYNEGYSDGKMMGINLGVVVTAIIFVTAHLLGIF